MDSGDVGAPAKKFRVFLLPYFATGHIIPMFELARLMASRPGVVPTILLTPANADLIRPSLAHSTSVHLHVYPFPSSELNLPPGAENIASVPSSESLKFNQAVDLVRNRIDPIIHDQRPDAIISDIHFWWVLHTARDLSIPGLTFYVVGAFPLLMLNALGRRAADKDEEEGDKPIAVNGLPGPPIVMPRSELPLHMRSRNSDGEFKGILSKALEAQSLRFGAIVNSFWELEPAYCQHFKTTSSKPAWFVGPVAAAADGGGSAVAAATTRDRCIGWLDTQKPGSVVFVCFGSWCHFSEEQLQELALGLEASEKAFLWVVRGGEPAAEWIPKGWEERVDGIVVRGWAPQVAILEHPAVGAFLTHCGWNSVLEAATAGVPMLTWPLVFEQFINERLAVEVMGAGARVWGGYRSTDEKEKVVVPGEAIGRAVADFMKEGGSGEEARRRATEYGARARAAVSDGGSSHRDLNCMIDKLMAATGGRGCG